MHEKMNAYGSPIFYSKDGDDSTDEYIKKTLTCDYLPYDQRHFKGLEKTLEGILQKKSKETLLFNVNKYDVHLKSF